VTNIPANDQVCSIRLSLTNFTISRRIKHTWSLAGISVTDELYYIKTYRTHLIIGRDICQWRTLLQTDIPANDQVCSIRLDIVKFVSDRYPCQWSGVFDTSWYSKVRQWQIFRTHLIIGREICHWGSLLYQDVSNTPDHWQGYLSLTNFTISRRIEHTGVFDASWYSKVRQWQISLPMIRYV
jgi:hypothetical protein